MNPRTTPASRRIAKATKAKAAKVASDYELIQRIDETENRWMGRIDDLATRVAQDQQYLDKRVHLVEDNLTQKIQEHTDTVTKHIDARVDRLATTLDESIAKLDRRIGILERWRWVILGGAIVIMFIISNYLVKLWMPLG